jgi:excisionase family DNA binding protein
MCYVAAMPSKPARALIPSLAPLQPRGLNLKRAAEYLGCKLWAVRELVWKGELKAVRIGKCDIIDVRDLDAWLEKQKAKIV